MNRLLSILVTLFILFLVYLWIHHLISTSAHSQSAEQPITQTNLYDDIQEPEEIYEEIPEPEEAREVPEPPAQEEVTPEPEPVNVPEVEKPKPVEKPKEIPKTAVPVKTPPAPAAKPVSKSVEQPSGLHLVIAGNFLARANAEERVKQLQKLGYSQAEVVNFELSEYHTACAGRYSDINEARRIAKKIKEGHNIDTYVRNGN